MQALRFGSLVLVLLLAGGPRRAGAGSASAEIVAVPLGALPVQGGSAQPRDLNDAGQVVGTSTLPGGQGHAFLWSSGGGMVDLGTLGGSYSDARAINKFGDVVGASSLAGDETWRAFFKKSGRPMENLGFLPGFEHASYFPAAVNDAGVVVGHLHTADFTAFKAFRWSAADGLRELPGLGGEFTSAVAINASGVVAGTAQLPTGEARAVTWSPAGVIRDLGHLGGGSSVAIAINDAGQVAGNSDPGIGTDHPFFWEKGKMTDLGSLTGPFGSAWATDINAAGQVCGTSGVAWPGSQRAFLWSKRTGMVDLGSLEPDQMSEALALNDTGRVIGTAVAENGWRAFVYDAGPGMRPLGTFYYSSYGLDVNNGGLVLGHAESPQGTRSFVGSTPGVPLTDIGALGGGRSEATAVNNLGEVVGESLGPSLFNHAFFRGTDGVMVDLGTIGQEHARALDINNLGQVIVQVGTNAATGIRAFYWSRADGKHPLPGLGGEFWGVVDINNRGQVAGHSFTKDNAEVHATLWTLAGGLVDIGIPGEDSFASAINDDGHVVGYATVRGTGVSYGWVWKPGVGMKNLGTFGGGTLWPSDINNRGEIAGRGDGVLGAGNVAWVWKGNFTNLGGPNGQVGGTSIVRAINGMGVLIGRGYMETSGEEHAFAGDRAPLRDLGTLPGHVFSDARAINDAGEVAGVSGLRDTDDPAWRAFLARGAGPMIALADTFSHANAINAAGQVVGQAEGPDGFRQATLWNTR